MATTANSSKTVNKAQATSAQLAKELEKAKHAFDGAKMVDLSIPAVFQKTFGSNMFIGINGVYINVPVDGEKYKVPEPFYDHAMQAINQLT